MRVLCRHGHFAFYPKFTSEVTRFCELYDIELVRDQDFYTFPVLKEAPRYSLVGKAYAGTIAVARFESEYPWEVMKANNFVYNVALQLIVPKVSITQVVKPELTEDFFVSPHPLIQPGSRVIAGSQILSYDGEFYQDIKQLRIREFQYE